MNEGTQKGIFGVVLVAIVVVGSLYGGLSFLRGELTSECGGFSCLPGSVVLPGKELHHFSDHASARCAAWELDDLTKSAANSARAYAKRTYPLESYSELEQAAALAGCVEGIRSPLHALAYVEAPGGPPGYYYRSAAAACARRGTGSVAREFDVAPTPMRAARAYGIYKYPIASYGKRTHEMAYEGCLNAFARG